MRCETMSVQEKVKNGFSLVFQKYGEFVGRHPIPFIILPLVLFGGLSVGIVKLNIIEDPAVLYYPRDNRAATEQQKLEDIFPGFSPDGYSDFSVVARPPPEVSLIFEVMERNRSLFNEDVAAEINSVLGDIDVEYDRICVRLNDSCVQYGRQIMREQFRSLAKSGYVTYPQWTDPRDDSKQDLSLYLAGVEVNASTNAITSARVLKVRYIMVNETSFYTHFLARMESVHLNHSKVYYKNSESREEELTRAVQSDAWLFIGTVLLVIGYSSVATVGGDIVSTRALLPIAGVLATVLGTASAVGLLCLLGQDFALINSVVPFLITGIGVDDMFLLMSAWSETLDKPGLTIPARIGITLTFAGVGMTVTSLTDFLAFMIGYSSVFFSVRSFCLYAGVAVLCVYLCHLTLFTACLSLHGRRVYSHRHFLTCRAVKPRQELKQEGASIFFRYLCGGEPPKKPSEDESLCERLPRFFIPKLVTHRAVLYVVLVVFAALLGVSVYGAVNIEQGLKFKDLVLESSYYYDFITTKDKYFPDHIPIGFNIIKELDYADGKVQQRVKDLITTAKEDGDILSDFEHCWLTAFLNSAFFKNVSFPQELQSFLVQNPVFNADIITDPSNSTRIIASRCSVLSRGLEIQYDQADLMVRMREVADNSPLPVIAFQKDFELFEVYLATLPATLQTVGFAVVAIVVVCCFLLPHPFMVVLTTINILMIICNIFACMYFLGITLSSITMIHLVMSVGFSVDFSAHVCSAYLMSNSFTRKERAIDAITHAASPILNGGLSSLVGVLLLSTSETYIFSTFFKIMSFVLLFGILNSVIFLPAMLTLCGPEKQATIQPMNPEGHEKSNGMVPGSVFTNGTATVRLKSNGLVIRPFVIGGATAENGGDNPGILGLCNGTVYMIEVDGNYTAEIKSCNGIMLVAETDRKTTTLCNGTIHPVGSASNTTESAKCNGTVPMAEADNTTNGTPCNGTVYVGGSDNIMAKRTPNKGTVNVIETDSNGTQGTPTIGALQVAETNDNGTQGTPTIGALQVAETNDNGTQGTPTIGALQVAETNDKGTQGTQCSGTVGLTQGTETLHVTEADCNATKEITCARNAGADITAKRTPSNGTDDVIESDSNGTQKTPIIGTLQVAEEADSNATKEIPCAGIAGSDSSTVNGPQHTRPVPATQLHGDTASRTAPCTDHTPKTTTGNDSRITKQSQLAPRLQKVRGSVETFERERSEAREWRAQQQQNMSKRLIRMILSSKVTPQTNETTSGRNDKV